MQKQRRNWTLRAVALPLALAGLPTVSCTPRDRSKVDAEALAAWEAAMQDAGTDPARTPLPAAPGESEPSAENPPPIASIDPGSLVDQSSGATAPETCSGDAGACSSAADAGPVPSVCVATGTRDCTSELDNDCDGQPDNVLDAVCLCAPGSVEPCDEHPGLDGRGQCVAGSRTCIAAEGNVSSDWGVCEGAVGPAAADACTAGDDSDCDGTPNEDCPCVDGQTQECGPSSNDGICQRGVSTCVNAAFGECVGAIFAGARDCSSAQDNDCDGRPDNTLDNTCTCAIGAVQACGAHPGLDGNGQCRAGSQTCQGRANNSTSGFGACSGSVGPAPQDSCSILGDDGNCNGATNEGCVVLLELGERCNSNSDCGSARCDTWHADRDNDGFGDDDPAAIQRTCGTARESFPPAGFVASSNDCCDADFDVKPGQAEFFDQPQTACADVDPFDYNCDGDVTSHFFDGIECSDLNVNQCESGRIWAEGPPACFGGIAIAVSCQLINGVCLQNSAASYEANFCN